jgi:hypothetical protein
MPEIREASSPSKFVVRPSWWWLGVALGVLFGRSLMWFLSVARDWAHFKSYLVAEIVCVAIPFFLALLSPHRVIAVFIGLCMVPIDFMMLIFIFRNFWTLIAALMWILLLARLGGAVGRRYKFEDLTRLVTGATAVGFLLFVAVVGGGFYLLHLLRSSLRPV